MNPSQTFTLSDRIAMTLDGLCRAVAARIAPGRAGWPMTAPMIMLVWTRVRRADGKIRALLARFQAGRLRVMPQRTGVRGGRRGVASASRALTLPRRFAWLLPMVPCDAANYASQLRHTLGDPEMEALLRASPQAARVLAPVCRMLGIEASLLSPRDEAPAPVVDEALAGDEGAAAQHFAPAQGAAETPATFWPQRIRWGGD